MLRPHPLCRALPGPLSDTPQSHGDSYATVNCCCPHHPSPAGLQPIQPPLTSLQHSRRACPVGTSPWPSSASLEAKASPNCPAQLGKYSIKARASGNLFYPAFLALTFPKSSPQLEQAGIDRRLRSKFSLSSHIYPDWHEPWLKSNVCWTKKGRLTSGAIIFALCYQLKTMFSALQSVKFYSRPKSQPCKRNHRSKVWC